MRDLNLPQWLNRGKAKQLAETLQLWWVQVESWLVFPLAQIDPDTCTVKTLDLIALPRGVDRFVGESESLYRNRVKYAFINAKDAGTTAGFERIMQRLGVGQVETRERIPGEDWDVIYIDLDDSQLAANADLLRVLIQTYGRTCRRYRLSTISSAQFKILGASYSHNSMTLSAQL